MQTRRIATARRANAEAAVRLLKRRAWFDDDGEGTTPPTETPPDTKGGKGGDEKPQTIAQEEANRLIGEARKKGREVGVTEYRKALGLEGLELSDADIKTLIADSIAKREADKSETQKAIDAKTALEKRLAERDAELERERAERRLEKRDNAIKAALKDAKNADKTFAVLTSLKAAEVAAVQDADGTLDDKKLAALIETARKEWPEDFGANRFVPGSPSHNGGRATPPDDDKAAREANFRRMRRNT